MAKLVAHLFATATLCMNPDISQKYKISDISNGVGVNKNSSPPKNIQKMLFCIKNSVHFPVFLFLYASPRNLAPPTLARIKDDRKHQAHVPQVEGRRMVELARVEYSAACTLISDMSVCATYMNNRLQALSKCL